MRARPTLISIIALVLVTPIPAFAHHAMDGETPATFAQGLLSGFAHPVIGVDHLAALIGVGLLASLLPNARLLCLGFVAAMLAGVGLHLASFDLPFAEGFVAIATLAIGVLVAIRFSLGAAATVGLFAVAGIVHGYALGESIVGAENTPLFAYLLGLGVIQAALTVGVATAAAWLRAAKARLSPAAVTAAGVVIAAVGVYAFAGAWGVLA